MVGRCCNGTQSHRVFCSFASNQVPTGYRSEWPSGGTVCPAAEDGPSRQTAAARVVAEEEAADDLSCCVEAREGLVVVVEDAPVEVGLQAVRGERDATRYLHRDVWRTVERQCSTRLWWLHAARARAVQDGRIKSTRWHGRVEAAHRPFEPVRIDARHLGKSPQVIGLVADDPGHLVLFRAQ